jgi:hypothetical protein
MVYNLNLCMKLGTSFRNNETGGDPFIEKILMASHVTRAAATIMRGV